MEKIELYLQQAQQNLCKKLDIGSLHARNPIVHKWKITFRCIVVRELVAWRFFDLLKQAIELQKLKHILGVRILLRSAIETLALLIYINQKMKKIVKTGEGFHPFSNETEQLLLASRNKSTALTSINIITILEKCDKRYNGIMDIYADLSESAHPNWQGLMFGYAKNDPDLFEVNFENCWAENFGKSIEKRINLFLQTFEVEYNEQWIKNFEAFEKWIEENDQELKETK